jgi:hypothetical protein
VKYWICPFIIIFPCLVEAIQINDGNVRPEYSDSFFLSNKNILKFTSGTLTKNINSEIRIKDFPEFSGSNSTTGLNSIPIEEVGSTTYNNKTTNKIFNTHNLLQYAIDCFLLSLILGFPVWYGLIESHIELQKTRRDIREKKLKLGIIQNPDNRFSTWDDIKLLLIFMYEKVHSSSSQIR